MQDVINFKFYLLDIFNYILMNVKILIIKIKEIF